MNTTTERRVAVIGLGAMGGAMAATLHRAGWIVTGFDPFDGARAAAAEAGIKTTANLEDVAGTPYAVLSLPAAGTVETTVPQLLAAPGTVAIVDTTTSEPATSKRMAELAEARGAAFVDAPVSGGRDGAATGTLSAFVGATDAALKTAEPVLLALTGGKYSHIGGPGSGNVVKLLNNVLAAANLVSVGEALGVAKAYGIDPVTAAASISEASGGSRVSANMYPNWVLSGTHNSGFSLGLMARDAALAVDIAAQIGENPALLAAVAGQWQEALAVLGPRADFTEIARAVAPAITPAGAPGTSAPGTTPVS
ncbi:MAG: 6-phosphogluconate dehydrogenase [Pseudarthrobacter sp.]|uniref:NAD(P)-dependent oxidoreductase n=1 Tax=Pseudarthrobacter sp. BIM B-2242 TaxID=2772401 RepID=UPI00168B55C1|nr:NAD(P)-dependent oxidoreductase [Pseudarthrobacter sp. BIM B-2242]MCU1435522.1 6-phosphogluconate dehydrogenase [Pseudarthrobacter sp.]QOD02983.1 NAD(P)-dependent oxidoreductase [Pseudarthrobacter sp. BIM B-2242]